MCALFAALTGVLSQIVIPIGPVPINLASFAVLLSGTLLGANGGAISMLVYTALGLIGAPVFSMLRGGPQVLLGPTGGYIIGYIVAAYMTGFIAKKTSRTLPALACGFVCYIIPGTIWYMILTGSSLPGALTVCVFPFLLGDALKIALAWALSLRLRPILLKTVAS